MQQGGSDRSQLRMVLVWPITADCSTLGSGWQGDVHSESERVRYWTTSINKKCRIQNLVGCSAWKPTTAGHRPPRASMAEWPVKSCTGRTSLFHVPTSVKIKGQYPPSRLLKGATQTISNWWDILILSVGYSFYTHWYPFGYTSSVSPALVE